ncbi:hypothetical protein BDZ45DRAFT_707934 [Acephala macrosclerotiorum]|nr:hypothetical protein BDZ45DRAFT_707934 [Acephala macrosclerotiorum]
MARYTLLSIVVLATLGAVQKCPLQLDGRIPKDATLDTFDTSASPFNPQYVIGGSSFILQFPTVNSSLFDANGNKALGVTISPTSIFQSQTGFRRSELLPSSNTGTDPSIAGIKTIHFSIQKDTLRTLNISNEYQLFFLESNDYSTNQVVLKYGSIIGGNLNGVDKDSLMVVGNVNSKPIPLLYSTKFAPGTWHNFAITLNFNAGTTQAYYSKNNEPLASVSKAVSNVVSGQGEFHFGILKKPTGGGSDILKSGFQEGGINEGIVLGGL